MTRVYSHDYRHPDGDIIRIRGAGHTKAQAREDGARHFEKIYGVPPAAVDERTAVYIPPSDRGPTGL